MTRHLVRLQDLSNAQLETLLDDAARFDAQPAGHMDRFSDRIVCCAFFEPSTRTRLSFEAAAHRLGARVIGFSDGMQTSAQKGESLEDTVRILAGLADVVVLRHPETGAAGRAAAVSGVPLVNAGDGDGEHPTQALVDLFTIRKLLGRLEGVKVALLGDLRHGRTVHSLVPALQRSGAQPMAVPAPGLGLPDDLATDVPELGIEEAASTCDVLYVTRLQRERFSGDATYEKARGYIRVDQNLLERTGSKAIVMHPLPRVEELAADVDGLDTAKYFDQARNGLPVRMAVLAALLEESQ